LPKLTHGYLRCKKNFYTKIPPKVTLTNLAKRSWCM